MAFLLIEGLVEVAELIGTAIEADAAATIVSGATDGLASVSWAAMPEVVEAAGALGITTATIGATMAQTKGTTSIGSGEIPQGNYTGSVNDGSRNVVYDPESSTPNRTVYQPFLRGGGLTSERESSGGYGGVWFGQKRKRNRNKNK